MLALAGKFLITSFVGCGHRQGALRRRASRGGRGCQTGLDCQIDVNILGSVKSTGCYIQSVCVPGPPRPRAELGLAPVPPPLPSLPLFLPLCRSLSLRHPSQARPAWLRSHREDTQMRIQHTDPGAPSLPQTSYSPSDRVFSSVFQGASEVGVPPVPKWLTPN